MKTTIEDCEVETWYDKKIRLWTTVLKYKGNQIGEALYTDKNGKSFDHENMIKTAKDVNEEIEKSEVVNPAIEISNGRIYITDKTEAEPNLMKALKILLNNKPL
jgi:hypothetical protein